MFRGIPGIGHPPIWIIFSNPLPNGSPRFSAGYQTFLPGRLHVYQVWGGLGLALAALLSTTSHRPKLALLTLRKGLLPLFIFLAQSWLWNKLEVLLGIWNVSHAQTQATNRHSASMSRFQSRARNEGGNANVMERRSGCPGLAAAGTV